MWRGLIECKTCNKSIFKRGVAQATKNKALHGAAGQEYNIAIAANSAKFAKSIGLRFDEIIKESLEFYFYKF